MRQNFTSTIATVLTMTGVAVGLGNVWRFPYMMGSHGGGAFLLIFLFFVFAFAIPAVMAEWSFGRHMRQGPPGAFTAVWGKPGTAFGWLLMFVVLVADSYYLLVIAYITYTTWYSGIHGFSSETLETYNQGLGSSPLQYMIALGLLIITLIVLYRGLNKGIEKASMTFMPFFGVVIIVLIVYTLSQDGAMSHLASFLKPDFSQVTTSTVFAAMGQAFFSLSLGGTFFVIYGSYLRDTENIPKTAFLTGLGDAGAALLAALFIMPATLLYGLEPGAGPTLIFQTLPNLFAAMPLGRIAGTGFLLALTLVAFLSNMAALQVIVGGLTDNLKWSRGKALLVIGVLEVILILPTAFNPDMIGTLDMIFGSGMQCLGSGLTLLALTIGLGKVTTLKQIWGDRRDGFTNFFYFWIKWVIPLGLFATLIVYILDQISG